MKAISVEREKEDLYGKMFQQKHLKSQFYNFLCSSRFWKSLLLMHILHPKHTKLKPTEVKELLEKYNISLAQLPKIKSDDRGLLPGLQRGDIVKIERKEGEKISEYFRVVA